MNRKYLWAGIACIAIALLCIAALATAHEFSVYAIGVTEGAGYDPGFGISGEYQHRGEVFGFASSADLIAQKKHKSDSGFKYGIDAQGRAYLGDWYLGVGAALAGYDSEFPDGSHWRKDAVWPTLQTGFMECLTMRFQNLELLCLDIRQKAMALLKRLLDRLLLEKHHLQTVTTPSAKADGFLRRAKGLPGPENI